jgi:predicted transglutaminase-like cysteine proteinase
MSIKAILTSLIIFGSCAVLSTVGSKAMAETVGSNEAVKTLGDKVDFAAIEAKFDKVKGYTIGDPYNARRLPTRRDMLIDALKKIPLYTGENLSSILYAVNNTINRRVTYGSDREVWHQYDYWASPVETMAATYGDCEDFVILKYWVLLQAGVPAEKMRFNVVFHVQLGYHMVLGVECDNNLMLLDYTAGDYINTLDEERMLTPVYAITSKGTRQFWGDRNSAPDHEHPQLDMNALLNRY